MIAATDAASTLNSADNIAGGSGTDTLMARLVAAGFVAIPEMSSVEVINISNVTAGAGGINLISATGVTNVNVLNSVAGSETQYNNIAATGVTVGMDNADGTTTVSFLGAATRTGTSDAYSASISNGSGTGAANAVLNVTTNALNAADATFENVNIATAGAGSFVDLGLGDASYRVITVTGTATAAATAGAGASQTYGLTLNDANGSAVAIRTVNASGMTGTGGLSIDASNGTFGAFAFTGSAGNDRVVLNAATANAPNTYALNGGSGTNDILAVGLVALTVAAAPGTVTTLQAATGFETIEMTSATAITLDANAVTGIANYVFSGTSGAKAASVATANVQTGDAFTITQDFVGAAGVDVFTFAGAVAGQSMTLTQVGGVDLTALTTGNALTFNAGITTVNLVSNNINGSAAATANTITAATTVAAIDNATATNFVATGAAPLTIGAIAGLAAPLGFTQAVSFNGSALTGVTRIAGSAGADSITTGSAADIIYGGVGNDQLTGGSGNDQFRIINALNGTDIITDFTVGGDDIGILTGFVDFANTTGTQAGATLNALDYSDTVTAIANISAANNLTVVEIAASQTTVQITTATAAAATGASFALVFNSTTGRGEIWYDDDWNTDADRVQLVSFDNITTLAQLTGMSNADFVEYLV